MALAELKLAFQHVFKKLHPTRVVHGAVLAIAQVVGQSAKLVIANPLSAGLQYIVGHLKVDEFTNTGPSTLTGDVDLQGTTTIAAADVFRLVPRSSLSSDPPTAAGKFELLETVDGDTILYLSVTAVDDTYRWVIVQTTG